MPHADRAEQLLKNGDPAGALTALQDQVRASPADAKLRVFLVQLLCVLGQWERALAQLRVASELDPAALAMAQMYGEAIRCEAIRAEVFAGRKSPVIFGEPEPWLALLIESLLAAGHHEPERSIAARQRAFEEAPASSGVLNGRVFEWIADADSRLGPVLEAVVNGKYYWIPFARMTRIDIEPPADLRDLVWAPAHLQFENGGEALALIPTRYPGSERSDDGLVALARKTTWTAVADQTYHGLGQRVLTTDVEELPLMDVRDITVLTEAAPAAG